MLLMKITVDEDPALRNEEKLTDWSRRLVVMRRVAQGRMSFKILSSYRRHRGGFHVKVVSAICESSYR